MGLCELTSNEHDQEKLGALFEGIHSAFWKTNSCGLTLLLTACPTTHAALTERSPAVHE